MKPKITDLVGGYLVCWEDQHLEARVSRLHIHGDGHVTGMLALTSRNGHGDIRLMPKTQVNFSSEVTRAKLAKQLAEKFPEMELQPIEIFDYLGEAIQDAALSGSPAVEVLADDDAQPPPRLVDPIIYKGHQNIIYGEKGVNKSTLAYAVAMCLALPEWQNPLGLKIQSDYVQSMVLDWETDEATFRWYLGRLRRGMQAPGAVPIFYRRCHLPFAQDIEPIADEINRTGAKLLIVDSLGAAAAGESGELKSSQAALEFNAAVRKLPDVTTLIIGQTAKNTETGKKTVYGSTYFTYYARNIFELCRGEDGEPRTLHLGLFHRECNFALKSRPMGIKVTYGEDNSINLESEPLSMAEFSEKVSATQRIMNILSGGGQTTKQLVERTGEKRNTIDKSLERLQKADKVYKTEDDLWFPTSNREEGAL